MSALAKLNRKRKKTHDVLWQQIYAEAEQALATDNIMGGFLRSCVLDHNNLEQAVLARLTDRLYYGEIDRDVLHNTLFEATAEIADWPECLYADIVAVVERDPASHRLLDPLLYLKGFHAIQAHRIAHVCWLQGRTDLAYYLQSRSSAVFQTDIHPAARIGSGIFLDHATGLVVGETAVVEDNVSILHGVTLGGTGKTERDRHPKIRHGVLIGAGAKILGNIEIGACSKIAAGSMVLKAVPEGVTVAGVPAQIIGKTGCREPARNMDQTFTQGEGI